MSGTEIKMTKQIKGNLNTANVGKRIEENKEKGVRRSYRRPRKSNRRKCTKICANEQGGNPKNLGIFCTTQKELNACLPILFGVVDAVKKIQICHAKMACAILLQYSAA